MNIVQIAGHVGGEVESRFTASGLKVSSFSVATNSRRGGQDETIWWRVTVWGDRFDKMLTYFKKGSAVIVYGEVQKPQMYTDRNGEQRIGSLELTAEMIRFSPFGRGDRQGEEQGGQAAGYQQAPQQNTTFAAPSAPAPEPVAPAFSAAPAAAAPMAAPAAAAPAAAPAMDNGFPAFGAAPAAGNSEDDLPF